MARQEPAVLHLHGIVMDLRDKLEASALADDGVIVDHEQECIDLVEFIGRRLEIANAARLRAQEIENAWSLDDSPMTRRRVRELRRDFGPEAA